SVVTFSRSSRPAVQVAVDDAADTAAGGDAALPVPASPSARGLADHPVAVIGLVGVVLVVPMVVALITLTNVHWFPLLDLAWTEMRLRDVWSSNPPLLGLAGRIGPFGHQGSHPGPLSFYVMWPVYALFGSTAWGMELASVFVHVAGIAIVLWIAYRRGGLGLVLGMAAVLAVLLRAYGASLLTQAWNPYLPVVWWLVFLLSVWSVLCDDWLFLPVAVFAGTLCAQTEVSYLGLCVALGAVAVGVAGVVAYRRRHDRAVIRRFATALVATVVVAGLVWLPPVVQQLTTAHGNLGVLFNYFRNPPQAPAGLVQGVKVMLAHLNPVVVVTHALVPTTSHVDVTTGSVIPGSVFLALWLATAFAAWRSKLRALVGLHAVIAITLVIGVVSISRIFGILWYYLVLWAWGVDVLMVVAVGWTLVEVAKRSVPASTMRPMLKAGAAGLVALTVGISVLFAVEASDVEVPTPRLSETLGALVSPTAHALDEHVGVSDGRAGRYLVTFTDPDFLGSQAFGLMNELERRGFQVGAVSGYAGPVTPHRVLSPQDATAVVHLSVGPDIATWQSKANARQVAYFDPRSPNERLEYQRLHAQIVSELQADGLSQLIPGVDGDLFATTLDPRLSTPVRQQLAHLSDLGVPAAVFIAPTTDT
ncbi:MAG TPA: hypothetical protein VI462_03990, partial [Acidimicrobiia bacterium]